MNIKKRLVALIMCILMLMSLLPVSALADYDTPELEYWCTNIKLDDGLGNSKKVLSLSGNTPSYASNLAPSTAYDPNDRAKQFTYWKTVVLSSGNKQTVGAGVDKTASGVEVSAFQKAGGNYYYYAVNSQYPTRLRNSDQIVCYYKQAAVVTEAQGSLTVTDWGITDEAEALKNNYKGVTYNVHLTDSAGTNLIGSNTMYYHTLSGSIQGIGYIPAEGYEVYKLTINGGATNLSYEIDKGQTIPASSNISRGSEYTVNYYIRQILDWTVTYEWLDPPTTGVTLPTDDKIYTSGDNVVTVDDQYTSETTKSSGGYTYTFSGWFTDSAYQHAAGETVTITAPITFYGYWTKTANTHSVSYEYTGDVPEGAAAVPAAATKTVGDNVAVADDPAAVPGYTFSGWETDDAVVTEDGKFAMPDSDVVFKGSWELKNLSYTVNYYWNGDKAEPVSSSTVSGKKIGDIVTVTPAAPAGYTLVSASDKTITIEDGVNKIDFYCYKNVELTANSKTVTYNGNPYSVSGFTGAPAGADFSSISVGATGTDAGTYPAAFPTGTVGTVDKTSAYIVTKANDGKLVIDPISADKIVVTITGHNGNYKYDGDVKNVSGYDVQITGSSLYKESCFTFAGSANASGTDAGTYKMNLKASDFNNISKNFTNVEFVIKEDGVLNIAKREVLLVSGSASKEYDGTPLSNKTVQVKGDGFVDGDILITDNYTEITNAQTAENKFTYSLFMVEDISKNYNIKEEYGVLEVKPVSAEVTVSITGHSLNTKYNGAAQSVTGYDANISNALYKQTYFSFSGIDAATGKDAGTYNMGLKDSAFKNTNKNFANVNFVIVKDGVLSIAKRDVTVTSASDSKVYDGQPLTNSTVEISGDGFVDNSKFKPNVTGSIVGAGTVKNSFTYVLEGVDDITVNYNVTKVEGDLTVSKMPITITACSAQGSYILGPITSDKWTSTATADGDSVVSVKVTGSQTTEGESANVPSDALITNADGTDVTANYDITYVNGVLKAMQLLEKEEHFNYVIGYPDGSVNPNGNITRAEAAVIFFRLLTDEARDAYMTSDCSFTDVKAGSWYTNAVATLENIGILGGYPDGTFKPNNSITRAEMAKIIAKFAKLDSGTKTFSDISGHWARKYVELAAGNDWIKGYSDGTFRPNNNITRAETFTMINRVLERQVKDVSDLLPTKDMNMWTDNMDASKWYYKDVQEATNYHKCDRVDQSNYEKWTEKVPDIDWSTYQF